MAPPITHRCGLCSAKEQPAGKGPAEGKLKLNANGTAAKKDNFLSFLGWTVPLGSGSNTNQLFQQSKVKSFALLGWFDLLLAQPLRRWRPRRVDCLLRKEETSLLSYNSNFRVEEINFFNSFFLIGSFSSFFQPPTVKS